MSRHLPKALAGVLAGAAQPFSRHWYEFFRHIGIDLQALSNSHDALRSEFNTVEGEHDALDASVAAHIADLYGHGWTVLADKAIGVGETSIAHGLGSKPTDVIPIKDLAPQVYVQAHRSAAYSLTVGDKDMIWEVEDYDWGGNYSTSTGVFTAPHTGLYRVTPAIFVTSVVDGKRFLVRTYVDGSQVRLNDAKIASSTGATNLALGRPQDIRLTANEALKFVVNNGDTAARTTPTNSDQDFLTIRSDDSWSEGTHDATNLKIWSARTRTMSFLVR